MIKCVDERGIPIEGTLRNPGTNAVVFEKTKEHAAYIREREQSLRITQLEEQVQKMMEYISTALNK